MVRRTETGITGKFDMTDSTGMSVAEFYGKKKQNQVEVKRTGPSSWEAIREVVPPSQMNLRRAGEIIMSHGGVPIGVRMDNEIITYGKVQVRVDGRVPKGQMILLDEARARDVVEKEFKKFFKVQFIKTPKKKSKRRKKQ
jgi:hypothetical protein